MAARPNPRLHVALASGPQDDPPAWVDLSDRLTGELYARRGRPRAWAAGQATPARYEAGELAAVLRNQDRALDPSNTASPYYPLVEPGRPMKLEAEWGNLVGNADVAAPLAAPAWTPSPAGAGVATLTITAGAGPAGQAAVTVTAGANANAGVTWELLEDHPAGVPLSVSLQVEPVHASAEVLRVFVMGTAGEFHQADLALPAGTWRQLRHTVTVPWAVRSVVAYFRKANGAGWAAGNVVGRLLEPYVEPGAPSPLFTATPWQTWGLWTGFMDRPPPEWAGREALVLITGTDRFRHLARAGLPPSIFDAAVVRAAGGPPDWWLRMTDPQPSSIAQDHSPNRLDGRTIGTVTFAQEPLGRYHDATGALFAAGARVDLPDGARFTRDVTVAMLVRQAALSSAGLDPNGAMLWAQLSPDRNTAYDGGLLSITDDGRLDLWVGSAALVAAGGNALGPAGALDDNQPHLVVARYGASPDDAGAIRVKLNVDGVEVYDQAANDIVTATQGPVMLGTPPGWDQQVENSWLPEPPGPWQGGQTIQDAALWRRVLTDAEVAAIYDASRGAGWAGDRAGARLARLFDLVGIPAAWRSFDVGSTTLGPQLSLGGKVLERAHEIAIDAEAGAFYVAPDGPVRFRERHALLKAPARVIHAVFGDQDGETPMGPLTPTYSDDLVVNVARYSRAGGQVIEERDEASIDRYDESAVEATDLLIASDLEVADAARWRITRRPAAQVEFERLELPLNGHPDLTRHALERDLEDRVEVRRTPPGGGPRLIREVLIQQVEHHWAREAYRTTWALEAADPGPYLVLDDPEVGLVGALLAY